MFGVATPSKPLKSKGVYPESCWPYEISKFRIPPSHWSYQEAKSNIVSKYERITNFSDRNQLRACLKAGYPFVYGFQYYPSLKMVTGHFQVL